MRDSVISIGMPVYNGGKHIKEAVESLLGQTFGDFDLFISDNASTDETSDLCRDLATRDHRVRYERNENNVGLIANYNRVFRLTTGRYFKWASSNDICDRTMLEECMRVLENQADVVLCYPRTKLFTDSLTSAVDYEGGFELMEEMPSDRARSLVHRLRLNNAMNGLLRRSALERTTLLENYLASDVNLLLELSLLGKFREVPQSLFYRRVHPTEITGTGDVEDLLRAYDPRSHKKTAYKFWRLNFEHIRSVSASSIDLGEKFRLYRFLCKKWYWDRGILWTELVGHGRAGSANSAKQNGKRVITK